MSQPFFSVIIPTFNRPEFAEKAINSVLNQTFKDFEIVLVDDGSDKSYAELIVKYSTEDSFVYHKQENSYLPSARNKGISIAKGEWICFLDDDDYYLSNHLELLKELIESHNAKKGLYRTFTFFENEREERTSQPITKLNGNALEYILNENILTVNNVCLHHTLLHKDSFDSTLRIAEDYNLWLRLLCSVPMFETPHYTTVYYKVSDSMSGYNLANSEKYLRSYLVSFSDSSVKQKLAYPIRKQLIEKYLQWAFDCSIKERRKVDSRILAKVWVAYPSLKSIGWYAKYLINYFLKK